LKHTSHEQTGPGGVSGDIFQKKCILKLGKFIKGLEIAADAGDRSKALTKAKSLGFTVKSVAKAQSKKKKKKRKRKKTKMRR
jgi:hypothetical protein